MRLLGTVAALCVLCGCGQAAFQCESDADCLRGNRPAGTCEIVGYCSFPDSGCPSGRRYGEFSAGFGGLCAPSDPGGGTSSGSTGSSTSTGAYDDSTTSIEVSTVGTSTSSTGAGSTTEVGSTGTLPEADLALWLDFEPGEPDKSPYVHPVSCEITCPSGTVGVFGSAAAFDADYLEVAAHPVLELSGPFTLTVWIRVDGMNPLLRGTVLSQVYADGASSYDVSVRNLDGNDAYELVLESEGVGTTVANALGLGQWRFLAVRLGDGQQEVLLDGAQASVDPVVAPTAQQATIFVGGTPTVALPFIGALDDLRLYRRRLSDAELAEVRVGMAVE